MAKIISVFNNKGGVGKTTICWNLAEALAQRGKRVLIIDFDPQCNLSIAMMGEDEFVSKLSTQSNPYGTTIRTFLQRFLQNTPGEEVFLYNGKKTNGNVSLIAGDFWLNVYADSLNYGADLLTGIGLSRYVALRRIVESAEAKEKQPFDFAIVDLPPSFGTLVRASFYSSDYYIVPCTSDSFSAYCIGLIGQMVPSFIKDWEAGINRFNEANPQNTAFNSYGKPVFAGWVFNGFDTARKRRTNAEIDANAPAGERQMVQADRTMHSRLSEAVMNKLVAPLRSKISNYEAVGNISTTSAEIGDIEDANVLIQNSLWLNVPLINLGSEQQVVDLQNRRVWAQNQIDQINLLRSKFDQLAENVESICT